MALATAADLLTALRDNHLLRADQVEICVRELGPHFPQPQVLADELVRRGWLTPYQVEELFHDRGPQLLLGSYVLLEKLGEGGMGAVFRARNWKLDRVVALKVIRKERLSRPDAVRRFYREVRSAAQLDHPHIVRALDADEVQGTHFLVMEFIAGTDLHRVVKTGGPLPILEACESARQAALGLQHAFERGMVHRDIKPANLLLCAGRPGHARVVKLLDMGLALMESSTDADERSSTITHSGVVMGTPDYMAPEQSLNAHEVDIRADLYSLGCTLYFLLTGRAPFTGGTLTQKLLRHQIDEPEPLSKRRSDVPVEVETVVRKLLAKRPEDRYQTPTELVQALEQVQQGLTSEPAAPTSAPSQTEVVLHEQRELIAPPVAGRRPRADLASRAVPLLAGLMGALLLGGGIWWVTRSEGEKKEPEPKPEIKRPPDRPRPKPSDKDEPSLKEPILPAGPATNEWVLAVQALSAEQQARAVLAKLKELNPGFDDQHDSNGSEVKDGKVVGLRLNQAITDITPVRALKHLASLKCYIPPYHAPAIVSLEDLSPLKGLPLQVLSLAGNRVEDLSPLAGMPLTTLRVNGTRVRDLTPLRGMTSLQELDLSQTPVADLAPLQGLKQLSMVMLANSRVRDIKPLAGAALTHLDLTDTDVRDLSPLNVVPLRELTITGCLIEDLSPLTGARNLFRLEMYCVPYRSLGPLKSLAELKQLGLTFDRKLSADLKQLPALTTLNGQKTAELWKILDPDAEQEKWAARVAGLPAEEQTREVLKRMLQLNPQCKPPEAPFTQAGDAIVEADFKWQDHVTDLRFLAPLGKLKKLVVSNRAEHTLEPLRGLRLESIVCCGCPDLSPLAEMPLRECVLDGTPAVRDFDVLRKLPALRHFHAPQGRVDRLAPLADLHLSELGVRKPRDLHLLANMKTLKQLNLVYDDFRHRDALRAMTWLENINGQKREHFWKGIAEQQVEFVRRELKRLNPGFGGKLDAKIKAGVVTELSLITNDITTLRPLQALPELQVLIATGSGRDQHGDRGKWQSLEDVRGLKLRVLDCGLNQQLKSLAPLAGMPLTSLNLRATGVTDLSPLAGMKLQHLACDGTGVADIKVVRGMPLDSLDIAQTHVRDLGPLEGSGVKQLWCHGNARLHDLTPLRQLSLEGLYCDFNPGRDTAILRQIKTLKSINGKPKEEVLK